MTDQERIADIRERLGNWTQLHSRTASAYEAALVDDFRFVLSQFDAAAKDSERLEWMQAALRSDKTKWPREKWDESRPLRDFIDAVMTANK